MRKLLFCLFFLFTQLAFSQVSPVADVRVTSATDDFGKPVPVGWTVYNVATGKKYICNTAADATDDLTSAAAKFKEISTSDHNHSGTYEPVLTIGNLTESTSSVLTISGGTGAVIGSGASIQVKAAGSGQAGYLSSTDWNTFNGKQAAYSNLTAFGSLSNTNGWLKNNGGGSFVYSYPTYSDVGAAPTVHSHTGTYQPLATNLTSIGNLANSAGWLYNNGAGTFSYSSPGVLSIPTASGYNKSSVVVKSSSSAYELVFAPGWGLSLDLSKSVPPTDGTLTFNLDTAKAITFNDLDSAIQSVSGNALKVDTIFYPGSSDSIPTTKAVVDYVSGVIILDSADIHTGTGSRITKSQLARTIIYDDTHNVGYTDSIEIDSGYVGQYITITARNTGKFVLWNNSSISIGGYGFYPDDWSSNFCCGDNITLLWDGDKWTRVSISTGNSDYRSCTKFFAATGGTVTTSGDYKIHVFTSSGIFAVSAGGNVEVLVVAGGGGGGSGGSGGGGGGGVIYNSSYAVGTGSITVTIGAGGSGGTSQGGGSNGNNSVFSTLTAVGGGGGAAQDQIQGNSGGSGGGGGGGTNGYPNGSTQRSGGSGTTNQGYAGGLGVATDYDNHGQGGGGGGATEAGSAGSNTGGSGYGEGGEGYTSTISGSSYVYASGGGAGNMTHDGSGTYGNGGTGAGHGSVGNTSPTSGSNYGSGGGGSGGTGPNGSPAWTCQSGGAGQQGIVIIKYKYK